MTVTQTAEEAIKDEEPTEEGPKKSQESKRLGRQATSIMQREMLLIT